MAARAKVIKKSAVRLAEDGAIVIWTLEEYAEFFERVKQWCAENTEYVIEVVPYEDMKALKSAIWFSNVEDTLPDLVYADDVAATELRKIAQEEYEESGDGIFLPISQYFDTSDIIESTLYQTDWKAENDDFYYYPCSNRQIGLFYRKDIVEEVGAEMPDILNMEELYAICDRIHEMCSISPLYFGNEYADYFMRSAGMPLLEDIENYDEDWAREFYNYFKDLYEKNIIHPNYQEAGVQNGLFKNGEIAFAIGDLTLYKKLSGYAEQLETNVNWSVTGIPKFKSDDGEVSMGSTGFLFFNHHGIDAEIKNNNLISLIDFVKNIFGSNNALITILAEEFAFLPACMAAFPALTDVRLCTGFDCNVLEKMAQLSLSDVITLNVYEMDITALPRIFATNFKNQLNQVVSGEITSSDALSNLWIELTEDEIEYISILHAPNKNEYYEDEYFDPDGMEIEAHYPDGTSQIVTDYTYSPKIISINTKYIIIKYGIHTVKQEVTVLINTPDNLNILCNKNYYMDGDKITSSDFDVFVVYTSGLQKRASAISVTPAIACDNVKDVKIIAKTYYHGEPIELSVNFPIVVEPWLKRLIITSKPTNEQYAPGDRFDVSGMVVKATYSFGPDKIIPNGRLDIKNHVLKFANGALTENVTISYTENGVTKSVIVIVNRKSGVSLDDCEVSQSLGNCGTGTLNLSSGKARYCHSDFISSASTMPIEINHINTNIGFRGDDVYGVGSGWRLNLHQEIMFVKNENTENTEPKEIWKYVDKSGKHIALSSGYEGSLTDIKQSAQIRNTEKGLQLYLLTNKCILVDASNNALVFNAYSGNYRLAEVHKYPSTPNNPKPEYMLKLEYSGDRLVKVSGGKLPDGTMPHVDLIYASGSLQKINYTGNGTTFTPVKYEYGGDNGDELTKITRFGFITEDRTASLATQFTRGDTNFIVTDLSSKDADGNGKYVEYFFDANSRVYNYYVGYGNDVDSYAVYYTELRESGDSISLCRSTYILHKDTITVASFNECGTASQYSYLKSTDNNTPYKTLYNASAYGFGYKAFSEVYSDTLDLVHIAADNSLSMQREYTFGRDQIGTQAMMYISLWLKGTGIVTVTIEVNGDKENAIVYSTDNGLSGIWQYAAFPLGGIKPKDKITVKVTDGEVRDFRITKAPYTPPQDMPETEYDDFGNVTARYSYEPINGDIFKASYKYNQERQLTSVTNINTSKKNIPFEKTEYFYTDGLMTETRYYGLMSSDYISQKQTYTDGFITQTEDENGVVTNFTQSSGYAQATITGEVGSPTITRRDVYVNDSDTLIETMLGAPPTENKNALVYNDNGFLNQVKHGFLWVDDDKEYGYYESEINFGYDTFGNINTVEIGSACLYKAEYDGKHLNSVTYGNGYKSEYAYDELDRVTSITGNGANVTTISYADSGGNTVTNACGVTYIGEVVNTGGVTSTYEIKHDGIDRTVKIEGKALNDKGNISTTDYYTGNSVPFDTLTVENNIKGLPIKIDHGNRGMATTIKYTQQMLPKSRTTEFSEKGAFRTEYTYNEDGKRKYGRITQERFYVNDVLIETIDYGYYPNGNIKSITNTDKKTANFVYDECNRLISEYNDCYGVSGSYKYNSGGNMTEATRGELNTADKPSTRKYDYSSADSSLGQNLRWYDQLKSIGGKSIKYDNSGNPLTWTGDRIAEWSGRRLVKFDYVEMQYDYAGQRTKKGDTSYFYQGTKLIAEQTGEKFTYYYYDESGVCGMNVNGVDYYYRKNIFGDIIGLYDANGNLLCKYIYDAWGSHKVVDSNGNKITDENHIGNINPFRYRGYYYDVEFRLYYLNSRYYDPIVMRFISPDDVSYLDPQSVGGLNLYAYCNNNPVMYADPNGKNGILVFLGIIGINAIVNAIGGGIAAIIDGQNFLKGFAAGAIGGAIGGAVSMIPGLNVWGIILGRGTSSAVYSLMNELFQNGSLANFDWGVFGVDVVIDMLFSMLYADAVYNFGAKIFRGKVMSKIISNSVSSFIGGIIDSAIDIFEDIVLFFNPITENEIEEVKSILQKRRLINILVK